MIFRISLIPTTRRQRPEYPMQATSITVHNTANPNATAANHENYVRNNDLSASYHLIVDDKEAILLVPLNEQAWHTGTSIGNRTSIGIEVCEFSDKARQNATDLNAQKLIAGMLKGTNPTGFNAKYLTINNVRTHQSWLQYGTVGKYCPRLILPWWNSFKAGIVAIMNGIAVPPPVTQPEDTTPLLKLGATGAYVKSAQTMLNNHGAKLVIDGVFGPATRTAVIAFQKVKGLVADGIIGDATWAALAKAPVQTSLYPTLKRGMSGSYVRIAQTRLTLKGFKLTVDGIFGWITYYKVRSFQKSRGLTVDGIIGPKTWTKLLS